MWLAWGSASRIGELAIHKVIVHKANEDCIISIDELGVVLSILLAMGAEALVTPRRILPTLLLVLNVLVLLLTSSRGVPLGCSHSGKKKRLKLSRACKEGRLASVDFLCFSLRLESISMHVRQYDKAGVQCHILSRRMVIISGNM
jgi:hypothetical protein